MRGQSSLARWELTLLVLFNLLLAVYGGAGLMTAARVRWDPTTSVVARQLLPRQHERAAEALAAGGGALLLLAHLALLALHARRWCRRLLLLLYAALMLAMVCVEILVASRVADDMEHQLDAAQAQVRMLTVYTAQVSHTLHNEIIPGVADIIKGVMQGQFPQLPTLSPLPSLQDLLPQLPELPQSPLPELPTQPGSPALPTMTELSTLPTMAESPTMAEPLTMAESPQVPEQSESPPLPTLPTEEPSPAPRRARSHPPEIQGFLSTFQGMLVDVDKNLPENMTVAKIAFWGLILIQISAVALALAAVATTDTRRPSAAS